MESTTYYERKYKKYKSKYLKLKSLKGNADLDKPTLAPVVENKELTLIKKAVAELINGVDKYFIYARCCNKDIKKLYDIYEKSSKSLEKKEFIELFHKNVQDFNDDIDQLKINKVDLDNVKSVEEFVNISKDYGKSILVIMDKYMDFTKKFFESLKDKDGKPKYYSYFVTTERDKNREDKDNPEIVCYNLTNQCHLQSIGNQGLTRFEILFNNIISTLQKNNNTTNAELNEIMDKIKEKLKQVNEFMKSLETYNEKYNKCEYLNNNASIFDRIISKFMNNPCGYLEDKSKEAFALSERST